MTGYAPLFLGSLTGLPLKVKKEAWEALGTLFFHGIEVSSEVSKGCLQIVVFHISFIAYKAVKWGDYQTYMTMVKYIVFRENDFYKDLFHIKNCF
ncbi:MAG: hypothetical protein AMJ45_00175 [Syntrophobacter sp. DG_60]|nr:MAG: hypothetical protein AMJ45_00175 [Syntrophobacter sp. DG_60]